VGRGGSVGVLDSGAGRVCRDLLDVEGRLMAGRWRREPLVDRNGDARGSDGSGMCDTERRQVSRKVAVRIVVRGVYRDRGTASVEARTRSNRLVVRALDVERSEAGRPAAGWLRDLLREVGEAADGHDESAWAQNRRGEFEVSSGGTRLNRPRS